MKTVYLTLIVLCSINLSAQNAISGFIDLEKTSGSQEIHLSQIMIEDLSTSKKENRIATSLVNQNGFFQFKKNLITHKDAIYRLYMDRFEDTLQIDQLFILSSRDSIRFKKSKVPFAEYTNTNRADKEWQKLHKFEKKLRPYPFKKEDSLSKAYIGNLKTYTKDSLEILMVKLIAVKQLDNKNLLDRDIVKTSDYYVALLKELKESDIERSEYLFLENKLVFLTTEVIENKYAISKLVNFLLGVLVTGLIYFVFRLQRKKNQAAISNLSKQEKNIQGLILQGKSNKEIADELFISLSTVKTHITNIYSKLKVSNRRELLRKTHNW